MPYPLTKMGEVLVLGHACGYRLDEIMGIHDFKGAQVPLQVAGLLDADGEPTREGSKLMEEFLKQRRTQLAAREQELVAQSIEKGKDNG